MDPLTRAGAGDARWPVSETGWRARHGLEIDGYEGLWRWSVDELEQFWADIWEFTGVIASKPYERVLALP